MKKILNDHDLTVSYTGPDGIHQASQYLFDFVLLDINLGNDEMDGCDVLHFLRSTNRYKTKPIFAVTAFALPHDEARFLDEGFDDYFSKPLKYQKLEDKIAQYKIV